MPGLQGPRAVMGYPYPAAVMIKQVRITDMNLTLNIFHSVYPTVSGQFSLQFLEHRQRALEHPRF